MNPSSHAAAPESQPSPLSCPWCGGRLTLRTASLDELVPGGVAARPATQLPPEVRHTVWVCETPHCRYRRSIAPSTPAGR